MRRISLSSIVSFGSERNASSGDVFFVVELLDVFFAVELLDVFFVVPVPVLLLVLLAYPAPDDVLFRAVVLLAVDLAADAASLRTSGAAAWIASSTSVGDTPRARVASRAEGPARSEAGDVSGRGSVVVALEIMRGSFRGRPARSGTGWRHQKPTPCQTYLA